MSEEAELLEAIFNRHDLTALTLYVQNGYDVHAKHHDHQQQSTLLHMAVKLERSGQQRGLQIMVELLIARGIAVDARDKHGQTALMLRGSVAIAAALYRRGADVHAVCTKRMTALHYSAQAANPTMVKFLLEAGASAAAVCRDGETPLSLACSGGSYEVRTVFDQ
jgi:ankyrin repeat protein